MDYIIGIFDNYMNEVREYYATIDIFSDYQKSYRLDLLNKIINSHPSLRKLCIAEIGEWSKLLGINIGGSFLTRNLDTPPKLGQLLGILYSISLLKVSTFTDNDIDMDSTTLFFIKNHISMIIADFIIDCPYEPTTYLSKRLRTFFSSRSSLKMHYEIIALIMTIESYTRGTIHKSVKRNSFDLFLNTKSSNPKASKFTASNFRNIIKRTDIILSQQGYSYNSIEELRKKSRSVTDPLSRLCFELLLKSKRYINLNNIHLKSRVRINAQKATIFHSEYSKAMNVILGLGRSLGFDMLFFKPLDDNIFSLRSWLRHEPFSATAQTLYSFNQILTDDICHETWGTLSKSQASQIIKAFEFLVSQEGTVDRSFIDNTFNKRKSRWFYNEVVVNRWYSNPKFNSFLTEFNTRKQEIQSMGVIEFLGQDGTGGKPMRYPIAKSRFYDNLMTLDRDRLYTLLSRTFLPIHKYALEKIFRSRSRTVEFDYIYDRILIDRLDSARSNF